MPDRNGIAGQPPAPERLRPYYDQMPDIARFYTRPPDQPPAPTRSAQQGGARLSTAARKALPSSSFALPGGRYPINDPSHARNALARGAQHASPEELAKIKAAVHRKYPSIGQQAGARGDMSGDSSTYFGQYGARAHSDEAQDRQLIEAILHKHGLLRDQMGARMGGDMSGGLGGMPIPNLMSQPNMFAPLVQGLGALRQRPGQQPAVGASSVQMPQAGARHGTDWPPEHELYPPGWFHAPAHHTTIAITLKPRGKQAGARAPNPELHPRSHALTMASAKHLFNMGHITPAQHASIHADALSKLAGSKPKRPKAPALPSPPSFGSIAPPPMPGPMGAMANVPSGFAPPAMPPMQAGARMPPRAPPAKRYPKYGAEHYLSTPTPVSSGSMGGSAASAGAGAGGSAGARWWK